MKLSAVRKTSRNLPGSKHPGVKGYMIDFLPLSRFPLERKIMITYLENNVDDEWLKMTHVQIEITGIRNMRKHGLLNS
ncbi:hypothetical protein CEXT_806711 [Caerostris extrusa]|uniref:Uncharacterized protein n=1 Tax=Caerostris extrusa TaxID=172846 RepID=A0AAV4M692_CAEEX|nr:hypothetical protein CEXT_806711 [Caerostris extrusa]